MSESANSPSDNPTTVIVTDLDGTVWDNSLIAHPDTLAAIAHVQSLDDVGLLVATGRRRNSARRAFEANGIAAPAVLLNGAIGFDFVAEELFHSITFELDGLARVLDVLAAHDVAPVAYLSDTTAVALEGVTTSAHHLGTLEGDLVWWSREQLAERDDVLGLSMLGVDRALLAEAHEALTGEAHAVSNLFGDALYPPASMMVAPPGVDKQRGIETWFDHAGWQPERVIAMGDAGNDIAMLEAADVAVAIRTASDDVRALAQHEISPPAEGGWAEVLDLL